MIEITSTEVFGWDAAIRGMRNPYNSWDKSDSKSWRESIVEQSVDFRVVGKNDRALMMRLIRAGSDHAKFMRMINVTADITAPLYYWKEYDVYKVGTVANSCSTMHTIADKEFTWDDFSCEHLDAVSTLCLEDTIRLLNSARKAYNADKSNKGAWWQLIQLLPSSYNQMRTVQLNYAVLRNMYHARRNHKLDEWRDFCSWVESLPYAELITQTGGIDNGKD